MIEQIKLPVRVDENGGIIRDADGRVLLVRGVYRSPNPIADQLVAFGASTVALNFFDDLYAALSVLLDAETHALNDDRSCTCDRCVSARNNARYVLAEIKKARSLTAEEASQ